MSRIHKPLIRRIKEVLEEDRRVVAAWLEGSIARGEDDDYSDIDLWVSVKDTQFDHFIETREQFAAQLGPVVSILYPKDDSQPPIDSFHILLEEYPATIAVDVHVQLQSRKFKFTKDSAAEECNVLFDKEKVITYQPFNPQAVEEYVRETFEYTVLQFWHQLPRIKAMIERDDVLEAVQQYLLRVEDLVTLYRIMYTPEKVDWGIKDIEYDLPEKEVKVIYKLMPRWNAKVLRGLLVDVAKEFAGESKNVAKRLRATTPTELIKYVLREIK